MSTQRQNSGDRSPAGHHGLWRRLGANVVVSLLLGSSVKKTLEVSPLVLLVCGLATDLLAPSTVDPLVLVVSGLATNRFDSNTVGLGADKLHGGAFSVGHDNG